jgi:hypothetical protein
MTLVKVTIKPWEEIVIHESIRYELDNFIKLCCMGVQAGGLAEPLQWADGVVFRHMPMPPTEDVVKEMLAGKVHWSAIAWALMPKYQPVFVISEINARIPIVNVSTTAGIIDVVKALKDSVKS